MIICRIISLRSTSYTLRISVLRTARSWRRAPWPRPGSLLSKLPHHPFQLRFPLLPVGDLIGESTFCSWYMKSEKKWGFGIFSSNKLWDFGIKPTATSNFRPMGEWDRKCLKNAAEKVSFVAGGCFWYNKESNTNQVTSSSILTSFSTSPGGASLWWARHKTLWCDYDVPNDKIYE